MAVSDRDLAASERLRAICLQYPEAVERETWDAPTYRVRDKIFAMQAGGGERVEVWCKAGPNVQEMLIANDPGRYFAPPYLGPRGWIGIRLDDDVDWDEVEDWVTESYRLIAPKRLAAELDTP